MEDSVKACGHCIAATPNSRTNSELQFSWPLDAPFAIVHVDLWQPGNTKSRSGHRYLLTCMCDMTQFVVTCPVKTTHAHELARVFMQDVLLRLGFCGMVVVDDGNTFKGTFADMCTKLNIQFHSLSKGNHKALSVERFHRYLNKAVAIAANDRGTNTVFVEAAAVAAYAWNSSPIDGTGIVRSIPAIEREFKFPCDFEFGDDLVVTNNPADSVARYLRFTASNAALAQAMTRILLEERRIQLAERANEKRSPVTFEIGDIVTTRVQVTSKSDASRVEKLTYRNRGPFTIVAANGRGSYTVRELNKPNGATRQYPTEALHLLPPCIKAFEPLDTPDLRFLNHEHAPLLHPLKHALNIDYYSERWPSSDTSTFKGNSSSLPPTPPPPSPSSNPAAAQQLFRKITESRDKLFFISFTPPAAMRPQWFLVTVDLEGQCSPSTYSGARHHRTILHNILRKTPIRHTIKRSSVPLVDRMARIPQR